MKMEPAKYWRSLTSDEKQVLADEIRVTKVYLANIMNKQKGIQPSLDLAVRIEDQTSGAVSKKVLRPDINWNKV